MTPSDNVETQDRIMDAAENLFAANGFSAPLRDITNEAGVNVAAVSYHFGNKEGLIKATFARRFNDLNKERIRMLDLAEAAAGQHPPTLESIVHSFIAPTFVCCRKHPSFMRLIGRLQYERGDMSVEIHSEACMGELIDRYRAALFRTLPDTPPNDLWWCMEFVVGAMMQAWEEAEHMEQFSKGEAKYTTDEDMVNRLVRFAVAGFDAFTPKKKEDES